MSYSLRMIIMIGLLLSSITAEAVMRFGESLCHTDEYYCISIRSGDTWDNLFPDDEERDLIQRINRMNVPLHRGMTLAIPKQKERLTVLDVSPFPTRVPATGEKTIYVSQKQLAFGAYDENGELVWWGPLSSGSGHCNGVEGACRTPVGSFRIIRKQDADCISTVFPSSNDGENGGAEMPYCMHFFLGYALHGSDVLPGYPASHGCVRLFIDDARWLNEEFIDVPGGGGMKGTRVIIEEANPIQ